MFELLFPLQASAALAIRSEQPLQTSYVEPCMRRVSFLIIAGILGLPAAPAGAGSQGPLDLSLLAGRQEVGRAAVSTDSSTQSLRRSVQPGASTYLTLRVHNTSSSRRAFELEGSPSTDLFTVSYTHQPGDVTAAMVAGGYQVEIGAGKSTHIGVEIFASESTDTGDRATFVLSGSLAGGSTLDAVEAIIPVPPVRVWAVDYRGHFRCEATIPRRTLQPGYNSGVVFRVTNLTDRKRPLRFAAGTLRFSNASGEELWETQPYGGPAFTSELGPHRTRKIPTLDTAVRWSGPLSIRPICGSLDLPEVEVEVAAPGAPADDQAAVDAAVATPGSPFQSCEPKADGSTTTGVFAPPDGAALPALSIRCWTDVRREEGFTVVALNLVSPEDAPDYEISEEPQVRFGGSPPPGEDNFLAVRWSFVVTADEVLPYIALSVSRAVSDDRYSPYYELRGGQWTRGGKSLCGHEGYSSSDGSVLSIDWVTVCGAS